MDRVIAWADALMTVPFIKVVTWFIYSITSDVYFSISLTHWSLKRSGQSLIRVMAWRYQDAMGENVFVDYTS